LAWLRRSSIHSPARTGCLNLGFFDEDRLITQPFAVKDGDGFLDLGVIL
jgi:hypothetical protein